MYNQLYLYFNYIFSKLQRGFHEGYNTELCHVEAFLTDLSNLESWLMLAKLKLMERRESRCIFLMFLTKKQNTKDQN